MKTTKKSLGRVGRTARGFELIEFKDYYDEPCSLQASSIAIYEKPGTSAVWLGCNKNDPDPTGSPRMHLDRTRVKTLIAHLQSWLDNDTLKIKL